MTNYYVKFKKYWVANNGKKYQTNSGFCIKTLDAKSIYRRFDTEIVEEMIVKERKTKKIIYKGNDYNEYLKVIKDIPPKKDIPFINEAEIYRENGSVFIKKGIDLKRVKTADLLDIFHRTGVYLEDVNLTVSLLERKIKKSDKLYENKEWINLTGEKVLIFRQFILVKEEIIRRSRKKYD